MSAHPIFLFFLFSSFLWFHSTFPTKTCHYSWKLRWFCNSQNRFKRVWSVYICGNGPHSTLHWKVFLKTEFKLLIRIGLGTREEGGWEWGEQWWKRKAEASRAERGRAGQSRAEQAGALLEDQSQSKAQEISDAYIIHVSLGPIRHHACLSLISPFPCLNEGRGNKRKEGSEPRRGCLVGLCLNLFELL